MLGIEEVCWQAQVTTDAQPKVGLEEEMKEAAAMFLIGEVELFCFVFPS